MQLATLPRGKSKMTRVRESTQTLIKNLEGRVGTA